MRGESACKRNFHRPVSSPLLEVSALRVWFPVYGGLLRRRVGEVRAVDGVDFSVEAGETVGLVGESGSGKTTIGRAILNLTPATGGSVRFEGREILGLPEREFRPLRRKMQMIFQDPFGSLNPRLTIGSILTEPYEIHFPALSVRERRLKAGDLLRRVGLDAGMLSRYPHEFSGGQRQRIGIARALAVEPSFLVCDEPVSALDVSVQAAIVNLLRDLQQELGLSYLFIAHDLAVVEHLSDRVIVLHHGKVVESGTPDEIYRQPRDEYTRALLEAVPSLEDPEESLPVAGEG